MNDKPQEKGFRKQDIYSPYKVLNYLDKIEQLKNGELPSPVFVQWDLTNKCNLNCSFCFYRDACTEDGYKLTDWDEMEEFPKDVSIRILHELREMDVKAVEWTGGGEPTVHPHHKELFRLAQEIGLKQALVTNGALLDDESIDLIKDFEWVRFSVDASDAETYMKVKRLNVFDKVIRNIEKLVKAKKPRNIVGMSFIVCPDNYKNIHDFALLGKKLGVDNVRYSIAMTPEGDKLFEGIWDEIVEQLNRAKEHETEDFKIFSFSNRIHDLKKAVYNGYCGYNHLVAVVAPRGVYPCCRLKDDGRFNFGDLRNQSFKEIWLGDKRRRFLETVGKDCRFNCWMSSKNAFIQYIMSDDKPHKEFI